MRHCWTCGKEMDEELWQIAPREPTDPERRPCVRCHEVLEMHPHALEVMNMIRYAAGIPRVTRERP